MYYTREQDIEQCWYDKTFRAQIIYIYFLKEYKLLDRKN